MESVFSQKLSSVFDQKEEVITVDRRSMRKSLVVHVRTTISALILIACFATTSYAADTLRLGEYQVGKYYYKVPPQSAFASRFEVMRTGSIESIRLTLSGDTGCFRLRIFGNEGGVNAPVFEKSAINPIWMRKKSQGIEHIVLHLKPMVRIESGQFFICLDSMSNCVHLLTDTTTLQPNCISTHGGTYTNQMLRTKDNRWAYSMHAFAVQATVLLDDYNAPSFVYDSTAFAQSSQEGPFNSDVDSVSESINYSIGCFDLNGDGYQDVLNSGLVYFSNRGLNFTDVTKDLGIQGVPKANLFIDMNHDGLMDVLFIGNRDSSFSNAVLFINVDGHHFIRRSIEIPRISYPYSFSIADFNMDGYQDLIISQSSDSASKTLMLLINNHEHGFYDADVQLTKYRMRFETPPSVAFVDLNNDGRPELCIDAAPHYQAQRNQSAFTWVNESLLAIDNHNINISLPSNEFHPTTFSGFWGDINDDGAVDHLSTAHAGSSARTQDFGDHTQYYINSGFPDYAVLPEMRKSFMQFRSHQSGGLLADLDNNGRLDCLVMTDCSCNPANAWMQSGDGAFTESSSVLGLDKLKGNVDACAVDCDNDGNLDILAVQNSELRLYRNVGHHTAHYGVTVSARISPSRPQQPSSATVYIGSRKRTSYFVNGCGRLMQGPLTFHFGLETNESVDSVMLRWNDGTKQVVNSVDISSNNPTEADSSCTTATSSSVSDVRAYPNPFNGEMSIQYTLEARVWSSIKIYDVHGEVIAIIKSSSEEEKGFHKIVWDARDKNGHVVQPGSYLLQIDAANQRVFLAVTRIN